MHTSSLYQTFEKMKKEMKSAYLFFSIKFNVHTKYLWLVEIGECVLEEGLY